MNHVIRDHVDETVLIAEGMEPDAPRVGVLVDEALAMAIDEDAPGKAVRWAERQRALEATQPGRRRSGPDAHADPAAVVVRSSNPPGRVRDVGRRALLRDHGLVGDESTGGQNDPTASPDGSNSFVGPYLHSDNFSGVDDQCFSPGAGHHASGARRDGGTEALHEEPAGRVDPSGFVPARTGRQFRRRDSCPHRR